MRKLIGITSSQEAAKFYPIEFTLPKLYVRAIEKAGGLPVILPIIEDDPELIREMVERVDGIVLSGGVDVDPLLFGEEPHHDLGRIDPARDFFEMHVAKVALELNKPILGICRGCQMINVVAGGTVIQDIPSAVGVEKVIKHAQNAPRWYVTHTAEIIPGTKLADIFESAELKINSFHHQSVDLPAPGFIVSAKAKDGVIEGIESMNHDYAIGVQWHPELLWEKYPIFTKLFKSLVDAC